MSFSRCNKFIEEGDTVILYISATNMFAIEVKPKITNRKGNEIDNVFQTRYGHLKVASLIGKEFGSKIILPNGWVHVLYPTPELWTITLPHRTQILYTPDISMVVTQLEIGPGSVICEAGTGSGSLSHALLRAIGPTGKLHSCDFHKERVQVALDEFTHHGLGDRVNVSHRDVCVDGLGVEGVADAVFLDLPKPWEALPHGVSAIKTGGGRICSFSPCIEQVCRTCETMAALGLKEITTLECLSRGFQVKYITIPVIPDGKEVGADKKENSNEAVQIKKAKLDDEAAESLEKSSEMPIEESSNENVTELANVSGSSSKTPVKNKEFTPVKNKDFTPVKNKDVKFLSGITNLKMPGHTGYLTFATVPPGLKRTGIVTVKSNEDTDMSVE